MKKQIKRAVRSLNISYIFFWVLPAFLMGAGELELMPVGGWRMMPKPYII